MNTIVMCFIATGCVLAFAGAAWAIEHMARKQAPVRYKVGMNQSMNTYPAPHWSGVINPGDLRPGMELMFTESGKTFRLVESLMSDLMLQPASGWVIDVDGTRQFLTLSAIQALSSSSRLLVKV